MKKRMYRPTVAMLIGLFWAAPAFPQAKICSLETHDYGRYLGAGSGHVHVVQVIPKNTGAACLVSYAAKLTREHPGVLYEFFDAQSHDLSAYMSWQTAISGAMDRGEEYLKENLQRLSAENRYSDKWVNKHHIATLLASSDVNTAAAVDENGCQQWILKSEDNKTMATFDHICTAR